MYVDSHELLMWKYDWKCLNSIIHFQCVSLIAYGSGCNSTLKPCHDRRTTTGKEFWDVLSWEPTCSGTEVRCRRSLEDTWRSVCFHSIASPSYVIKFIISNINTLGHIVLLPVCDVIYSGPICGSGTCGEYPGLSCVPDGSLWGCAAALCALSDKWSHTGMCLCANLNLSTSNLNWPMWSSLEFTLNTGISQKFCQLILFHLI